MPGLLPSILALGDRAQEVAAEPDEAFTLSVGIAFAGIDGVQPFSRGGSKPNSSFELVERHELGLLGDADRPLPLDIGVAAHRRDAGAGPADIAPQQQQVDEHCHVVEAVDVLGQPHAVDADHVGGLGGQTRPASSIAERFSPEALSRSPPKRFPAPSRQRPRTVARGALYRCASNRAQRPRLLPAILRPARRYRAGASFGYRSRCRSYEGCSPGRG